MTGSVPVTSAEDREATAAHLDQLTKPPGSLGRLETLAIWAGGVQRRTPPVPFAQVKLLIFVGDHGVAAAGTSAFPPEVTAQMVANFLRGGAAANVLADRHQVDLQVVDVAVDSDYDGLDIPASITAHRVRRSSGSIDTEDALSEQEVAAAVALGRTLADKEIDSGVDLLLVGDMGIGNTTPAAALTAALTGSDAVSVCGRGTGIDDERWMRKVSAIRDALWRARDRTADPVDLLRCIGGADFAAMAAFLARSAERGTPVILDGLPVTAAALVAEQMAPDARAYWVAGHESAEPAHALALEHLDLEPVLRLSMRLGEGSGALCALPIVQAAIATCSQMATFSQAGVTDQEDRSPSRAAAPPITEDSDDQESIPNGSNR